MPPDHSFLFYMISVIYLNIYMLNFWTMNKTLFTHRYRTAVILRTRPALVWVCGLFQLPSIWSQVSAHMSIPGSSPFRPSKPCFKTFIKSTMCLPEPLNFNRDYLPHRTVLGTESLNIFLPSLEAMSFLSSPSDALCSSPKKHFRLWFGACISEAAPPHFLLQVFSQSAWRRPLLCLLSS